MTQKKELDGTIGDREKLTEAMKLECTDCGEETKFKPYHEGLFSFNGDRVYYCKKCGSLQTRNEQHLYEPHIVHRPTGKKKKDMDL